MPVSPPSAGRRLRRSPRRADDAVSPLVRGLSLVVPTLVVLVVLVTHDALSIHNASVILPLITLVTLVLGLVSNLVVLRLNTLHLHDQDIMLTQQTSALAQQSATLEQGNVTLNGISVQVNGRMTQMIEIVEKSNERIARLEKTLRGISSSSAPPDDDVPATTSEMADTIASIHEQSTPLPIEQQKESP